VHGIRGNRRNWRGQLEFFSDRFRAAACDMRGYGDSDDYEGPLEFDQDFSADVLRVADHFRAAKMHLVGLSMGGRIARNFALRHPQRLKSLTLVSTNPGFDAMSAQDQQRFAERRTRTPDLRKLLGRRANPAAHEELLDSAARVHQASFEKTLEASVAQDRAAPIEKIRVPTLVMAGEEDTVYSPGLARAMARRIPGAKLVMFAGTGHVPNLEQPERFNEALLDFLVQQEKSA
jgi:3-oxoadipate enol-lactonase